MIDRPKTSIHSERTPAIQNIRVVQTVSTHTLNVPKATDFEERRLKEPGVRKHV